MESANPRQYKEESNNEISVNQSIVILDSVNIPRVLIQETMLHIVLQITTSSESIWTKQMSCFGAALKPSYGQMS